MYFILIQRVLVFCCFNFSLGFVFKAYDDSRQYDDTITEVGPTLKHLTAGDIWKHLLAGDVLINDVEKRQPEDYDVLLQLDQQSANKRRSIKPATKYKDVVELFNLVYLNSLEDDILPSLEDSQNTIKQLEPLPVPEATFVNNVTKRQQNDMSLDSSTVLGRVLLPRIQSKTIKLLWELKAKEPVDFMKKRDYAITPPAREWCRMVGYKVCRRS